MPDIDKIKKLSSYFNITFDTLLDDTIDISTDVSMHKNEVKTVICEGLEERYRPVFVSDVCLRPDQADEDASYFNIKGVRTLISDAAKSLKEKQKRTAQLAVKQGYRVLLPLQKQALTYFFVDDTRKCCGIIFDAAEQFVCPFENFAGISEVAKMHPGVHRVTISYFNCKGYPMTYTLNLYPHRLLPLRLGVKNYQALCKEESLSISEYVQVIDTYAKSIIESGRRLRLPGAVAPELDMEGYRMRAEEARHTRGKLVKQYMDTVAQKKKARNIILLSIAGLIGVGVTLIAATMLGISIRNSNGKDEGALLSETSYTCEITNDATLRVDFIDGSEKEI